VLARGNLADFGGVLRQQWENWRSLSEGQCTTASFDTLLKEAEPYCYGARLNGAGGGGCATFVAREGRTSKLKQVILSIAGNGTQFYAWQPVRGPQHLRFDAIRTGADVRNGACQ
jgi:galactokinase